MNNSQAQQFAALQKATATYNNDAKMADHLRRREVDMMTRAMEQNRRDEEELRIAHGELGEEARKQKNIIAEKNRCKQATETDRQFIFTITSELKGIEADEKEQKIQFVKEMEVLNNENDLILTFRENKKASLLLDVESATWLVETKLDDFVKNKLQSGVDNEMQLLTSSEEDKESWSEMASRIKEGVAGLIEVEDSRNALVNEGNELEKCLGQLRAKFLSEQNNLGQMEIDDLEAKWEQQYECNAFDEEAGESSMVYDGEQPVNTSSEGACETSQVHMELFYND